MGHKLSAHGFSTESLNDIIEMTIDCGQEKQVVQNGSQNPVWIHRWCLGEGVYIQVASEQIDFNGKSKTYVKNMIPTFESESKWNCMLNRTRMEEVFGETLLEVQCNHQTFQIALTNAFEVPSKQLSYGKRADIQMGALAYSGKIKADKISQEDIEDEIEDVLAVQPYLLLPYQDKLLDSIMDDANYFIHGLILEIKEIVNPFTEITSYVIVVEMGKNTLPILINENDIESKELLQVGAYFEGVIALQGKLLSPKQLQYEESSYLFTEGEENIKVIAVSQSEMESLGAKRVLFPFPFPIEAMVYYQGDYYLFSHGGELTGQPMNGEEAYEYIEDQKMKWITFEIPVGAELQMDYKGKILIRYYDKYIKTQMHYPNTFLKLGKLMHRKEKYRDAIKSYSKALGFSHQFAPAYLYRAVAQEALQQNHLAIKDYRKVINIIPNHVEVASRIKMLENK